ncbi:DUF2306 domain-containing protein [Sphingobacterium sp. 2149]|uniref:DUF2306 domain-containing protein n=1 Tax=Sphingobacterium sp. 2149 TaxID=2817763 RepID=UPI002863006C|nr:DUF2306 domain-containing protein [Sphingobacterium sp. 2149]MDR6736268.1 putative membrane protein [Sphingobacterium sp. 2149]
MKKLMFILICVLALIIGAYPLTYVFVDHKNTFLHLKTPELLSDSVWRSAFFLHIIFAGLSLLVGCTQFGSKFRDKHLKLHRVIGKIYITSALIGAISGVYLGFYANEGAAAALGFIFLGLIWFMFTLTAFLVIRKGNILVHQKFMIYSYACTFAAVTLRVWYPLLVKMTDDSSFSYVTVAWLCWIPNILVAFFINKKK